MINADILEDIIVDAIAESIISKQDSAEKQQVLKNGYTVVFKKSDMPHMLITENMVKEEINKGKKHLKIPKGALVTPAARLLIEEKRIETDGS